jgi:biopolymer transport protein ExbD
VDGKPVPGKVYDNEKLTQMLSDIKDENPTEENIIISAESHIKYRYIIQIMDASRETKVGDKKKALFPNVVLSAGVA